MKEISPRRILVPINGNATDDEMVALACTIARRAKCEVHVINVIEVKRALPLDADLPPEAERGEIVLERAERVAESLDVRIQTDLLQARDVGSTIVDEARDRGADLILLGSTFINRYGEFDLGRTAPYVLKHALCRVWVCRSPAESSGQGARGE